MCTRYFGKVQLSSSCDPRDFLDPALIVDSSLTRNTYNFATRVYNAGGSSTIYATAKARNPSSKVATVVALNTPALHPRLDLTKAMLWPTGLQHTRPTTPATSTAFGALTIRVISKSRSCSQTRTCLRGRETEATENAPEGHRTPKTAVHYPNEHRTVLQMQFARPCNTLRGKCSLSLKQLLLHNAHTLAASIVNGQANMH